MNSNKDLEKVPLQYMITNQSTNDFKIGDTVFLRSNPDYLLIVIGLDSDNVIVKDNRDNRYSFIPQVLLQYDYAGLMVYNDKYKICMN